MITFLPPAAKMDFTHWQLPLLVARDLPKGEDSLPDDLAGRGPFRVTDGPSLSGHNLDLVIILVMITLMILTRMVIMERLITSVM